ncbi:X-X-X-Leu-X-X-Gly heptad repeat protein [Alkalibacillus filiformis]|uniref:X-X-X-Leu-X-X-Gly heptad repeat protein n=1 Tax=Alkalibacillus filiformis TaxID=200990 RepID=A0ABU0DQ08_9BACI|nr:YhgE/Pip domain-containing protein [Alkalibacillus filiformis]MDQ0350290.1 X-X-X-Leu-X-X-Gly heptad repeat protein [Alkalibacillus filiformis]
MNMKRVTITFIASLLLIPTFALATSGESDSDESSSSQLHGEGSFSEKHEVIYATLNAFGEQDGMYVVNQFNVTKPGEMIDFGHYESVHNLTNLEDIKLHDEEVMFTALEDEFYYQGNLNGQPLPWTVDLEYTLDGEVVNPHDIAGEDGQLAIKIKTSANEEVNPVFYDHYLLQVTLNLDSEIYHAIEAEDGTVASAGKNKQVTFTVMPGEDEQFVVEADVINFEFDGVEIAALPSSMSVDDPETDEMQDEMRSLSDGIADLYDGVTDLRDGVVDLNDGVVELHDGSGDYLDGVRELDDGSTDLVEGSQSIGDALQEISSGFELDDNMDTSDLEELEQGLREIAGGLYEVEDGLWQLRDHYNQAYDALDDAIADIPRSDLSEEEIQSLYMSGADSDILDELVDTYIAAQTVQGTYDAVGEAFEAVSPTLLDVSESLHEMATNLELMADELAASMDDLDFADDLAELESGLNELANQYGDFHAGLVDYTGGVGELSSAYSDIHEGISELNDGTFELEDGVDELHDGTGELAEETSDLPEQMQSEIDNMMNDFDHSDFEPVSFVSERNDKVETVQFVIQSGSITIDDDEESGEVEEEEKGIWERFLDLFR